MYKLYYKFTSNPFQLTPDSNFLFVSKVHKRAISYLQYGLLRGEGFIVITGEIGAGKTTLLQNLFRKLEPNKITAAQIVNTNFEPKDTLRMVTEAFEISNENATNASFLINFEKFLCECHKKGKRALLLVDEAQNLTPQSIEELRMLSNFQLNGKSLLQVFLVGQPEFRETLNKKGMEQLKQRVIASYHLGSMDADETRSYIEHRLITAKWSGDPKFSEDSFAVIYDSTRGIPRKINALCDRLLLMGCLEELHVFGKSEVEAVINDMRHEFALPISEVQFNVHSYATQTELSEDIRATQQQINSRLSKIEQSVASILGLFKPAVSNKLPIKNQ